MSNATLTKTFYCREDEIGIIPDPPATFTQLRYTGIRLRAIKKAEKSREITGTRGARSYPLLGWEASGNIQTEFCIGAHNDFVLAALQKTAWIEGTFSLTGELDAETGIFTVSAGFVPDEAQGARYFKIAAPTPGNSGIKRVLSCTANEIVLEGMEDSDSSVGLTMLYRYARDGRDLFTFTIESQLPDASPPLYCAFKGQAVDAWGVTVAAKEVIQQQFEFVGLGSENGAQTFGDGEPLAINASQICTGYHVKTVFLNGFNAGANLTDLNFQLSNGLRQRARVSSLENLTQGTGTVDLVGGFTAYFDNTTLRDLFLQHATRSVGIPFTDDDGNLFSVYLPRTKPSDGANTIGGKDADVFQTYTFEALESDGYTVQVDYLLEADDVANDNGIETFQDYQTKLTLKGLNGGIHFVTPWASGPCEFGVQASENFEQCTQGQLGGQNTGEDWQGPWADLPQALGVQVHYSFEDNTEGNLDGQGGGDGESETPWHDDEFHTGVKASDNFETAVDGGSLGGFNGGIGWATAWADN